MKVHLIELKNVVTLKYRVVTLNCKDKALQLIDNINAKNSSLKASYLAEKHLPL